MKRLLIGVLGATLLLTGCSTKQSETEDVVESDTAEEATITKYSISDEYYKSPFPYKVSETRGLLSSNMTGRLDIDNFETDLLRIAQETFSTDDYIFQEGQYLDSETVLSWIHRVSEDNPEGLNPALSGVGTTEQQNTASPLYLSHILEQDYLTIDSDNNTSLGGVVIGLAMNSVHYYNLDDSEGGYPREVSISDSDIKKQGEKMAQEILTRIRQIEGLEEVPVTMVIYKQEEKNSLVPGNVLETTNVGKGDSSIGDWEELNETYYLFPSTEASKNVVDDSTKFDNFKEKIEDYFPNYTGVIGRGFYIDNQLQTLNIDIPIQFYSKAEVIAFTQYVTTLTIDNFPEYAEVNVSIYSNDKQESLIMKPKGEVTPTVHIYD